MQWYANVEPTFLHLAGGFENSGRRKGNHATAKNPRNPASQQRNQRQRQKHQQQALSAGRKNLLNAGTDRYKKRFVGLLGGCCKSIDLLGVFRIRPLNKASGLLAESRLKHRVGQGIAKHC